MFRDFDQRFAQIFQVMRRYKTGLLGLGLIVLLVLVTFIAPFVVAAEVKSNLDRINQPPSIENFLGTDFAGRQNWIMFIHGGREVIMLSFLAGAFTTLIAVTVGGTSAFLGGHIDNLAMAITDTWLALPRFLLLIVIAKMIGPIEIIPLTFCLAIINWPGLARQVRAQFLAIKEQDYIEAARMLDLGTLHIIFREMLPGMMSYVFIAMIHAMIGAIYAQTGLAFLGLVLWHENWGVMFVRAYALNALYNPNSVFSLLVPMSGIILFQLGLVLFSRMLEEVFNPRLRQNIRASIHLQ